MTSTTEVTIVVDIDVTYEYTPRYESRDEAFGPSVDIQKIVFAGTDIEPEKLGIRLPKTIEADLIEINQ